MNNIYFDAFFMPSGTTFTFKVQKKSQCESIYLGNRKWSGPRPQVEYHCFIVFDVFSASLDFLNKMQNEIILIGCLSLDVIQILPYHHPFVP